MGSIWKSSEEAKILDLCHKYLEPKGLRAVDVDFRLSGRSLVRIFIERMRPLEGPPLAERETTGASIDDCAEASRLLGPLLDTESAIPGAYDLEVSSPGLDRRLRLATDFEKVVGEEVKVQLRQRLEGHGSKLSGRLVRVTPAGIVMLVQKAEIEIPLESIKLAHRVWQFKPQH